MSTEYKSWSHMIQRCYNSKNKKYADYGGRGITVCEEWRESFAAFYAYLGDKPGPEYSVDRIRVDGNYEPGNVRWATPAEQRHNQRVPVRTVHHLGVNWTLRELAEHYDIPVERLRSRLVKGDWPVWRALGIRRITRSKKPT